jgi:hypothetical protein
MIRSPRVHSRCPRCGLEDVDLFGVEDGVEGGGVFAVSVAEQEPHRVQARVEVGGEIPGLLGGPVLGGVGGDSGDVQASGGVFEEGEGVEAVAECGVEVEEVDRDDAVGLGGEELLPGRTTAAWSRVDRSTGMQAMRGGQRPWSVAVFSG